MFSRPGGSRGLLYKKLCHWTDWLTDWLSYPLVKISLRRRHAQMVKTETFSDKINYIEICSVILNLEGHLNCCIGLTVTAILLNGWSCIGKGLPFSLHSRLVFLARSVFQRKNIHESRKRKWEKERAKNILGICE